MAKQALTWNPQALEAELDVVLQGAGEDPLNALRHLVDRIRPERATDGDAELRLRAVLAVLDRRDDLRQALSSALDHLLRSRHAVLLFATSGIYPNTGLLAETSRRLSHKLLPEAEEPTQLKSVIGTLLRPQDGPWIAALSSDVWLAVVRLLRPDQAATTATSKAGWRELYNDLQEAVRVVAHRIAAAGLEPEFLRLEPTLEQHASPFMALCDEVLDFLGALNGDADERRTAEQRHRHILILADQSRSAIERVRRRAQRDGASFILTFRIRRLNQHLDRLQSLLDLHCQWDGEPAFEQRSAALLRELLLAECRRNNLRSFWRQNTELVALRVAENAGRSGEHYITSTRGQYMAMLRAAAGGGFIVACMAVIKLLTSGAQLAPLTEVLANCLNYGLGFVLIHLLNLAVATKQPAMTANAIAAALDAPIASGPGAQDARKRFSALVQLVARTVRTQLAAVCGNIAVALPTAAAIAGAVWWFTGSHFVAPDKAVNMLQGLQPFSSGALAYAAIAGVCLFLAGLIAGFYDNLCAYNRIPQRLLQLRWPHRLLGPARAQRLAAYIENNLGALAGNFSLGFLLGGASGLGTLLAWPVDVRHVTLTSANWGFAMTSLNAQADWQLAALAALGVFLIGAINLLVSFSLALWIAMRSRGIASGQGRRVAADILRALRRHPREFFLPPRKDDQDVST